MRDESRTVAQARLARLVVLGLSAALIAALAGGAPRPARGAAAKIPLTLERPLHLPTLKAGERCPVSPHRRVRPHSILNGHAPAYLLTNPTPGVIDVADASPDKHGWRGEKTPWAVLRRYKGPILVRGARIDRAGAVRFAYVYGQLLRRLYWPAGVDQGRNSVFRSLASETLFRSQGCYAYQVDGTDFSSVTVVKVVG